MTKSKITKRTWSVMILFGLFGQLAWLIENMYFNVYMYNTITTEPKAITQMVFWSAFTATVTTLLMGALSDRLGKRKAFMVGGYILWGISTMSFALIRVDNIQHLGIKNAIEVTMIIMIVMDCVMTFFGSTAYDATYNAWVNDVTPKDKRGRVETVLAILPLVAMAIIFGGFAGFTQNGKWNIFFGVLGAVVTIGGIIGIFLIKEDPNLKPSKDHYFKNIIYGFRPSVVKGNAKLYASFILLAFLGISAQIYMNYLIIYIEASLGITDYIGLLAIILVASAILSVVAGPIIDKVSKIRFAFPAMLITIVGLLGMYFIHEMGAPLIICGILVLGGNMMVTACIIGFVRDYTPKDKSGHFQGIRMFFNVLIPMAVGPKIAEKLIEGSGKTYVDLGVEKYVPTSVIFLAAGIVMAILLVATLIAKFAVKLGQEEVERIAKGETVDAEAK